MATDTRPQVSMMRAIQTRAPTRARMRLLGTSSSVYEHEEDAGPEAVDGGAEAEVAVHVERREADVHAVEIGHDVEQEQERDEPPAYRGHRGH